MTNGQARDTSDGLWRWLIGGLAGGAILLGLLVGAYAIGYDRGQDDVAATARSAQPATPPVATTAPPSTPAATPEAAAVVVTPALAARGEQLYVDNGCGGCHSLDGTPGAGPTLAGAAGREVELDDGETVVADDRYLLRAIADPDAQIVEGYTAGIMSTVVAGSGLDERPDDIRAIVAFLKSQNEGDR